MKYLRYALIALVAGHDLIILAIAAIWLQDERLPLGASMVYAAITAALLSLLVWAVLRLWKRSNVLARAVNKILTRKEIP